jgi:hypothetical protein
VQVRCEALWWLLPSPAAGRLTYLKVDIEERHFECVEAISRVPPSQRPRYVSWEMHEHARGLPYPLLDTQLILTLHGLGYTAIKVRPRTALIRCPPLTLTSSSSPSTASDTLRSRSVKLTAKPSCMCTEQHCMCH